MMRLVCRRNMVVITGSGIATRKLFMEGMTAYQHGDARNATDRLCKAIQHESAQERPDKNLLSDIHNIRGEVYFSVGVATRAYMDFMYAITYNPANENALNNLGVWHSIDNSPSVDYAKSLEYFDVALNLFPERKDIILNRAITRIKAGYIMGYEDLKKLELQGYEPAGKALLVYED